MNITKLAATRLIFLLLAYCSFAHSEAAPNAVDFHKEVVTLYSFEPHKYTQKQVKDKSDQLDQFWRKVRKDSAAYLPLLRDELKREDHYAFFYYDASKLLIKMSREKEDLELALKSIVKTSLKDVQHTDHLRFAHWLASQGLDTTPIAQSILDYPEYKVFVVQHMLSLGQDYASIFVLLPLPESYFVEPMIQRLKQESNLQSQKSILLILWYAMTKESRAALRQFAADNTKTKDAREYANKLINRKSSISGPSSSSEDELRKQRRKIMRRISDEALIELNKITAELLKFYENKT